ncbi:MAG TPA: aminopeptidase P family protein, partial [Gammaproteobacteria bacterium]|nr:aminopeptidase P family protein [Gammaproteobacteria bacterium]
MILQDNWSDLRRYREVPEIDFDRLRTYRMERIKSALREAEASMC